MIFDARYTKYGTPFRSSLCFTLAGITLAAYSANTQGSDSSGIVSMNGFISIRYKRANAVKSACDSSLSVMYTRLACILPVFPNLSLISIRASTI